MKRILFGLIAVLCLSLSFNSLAHATVNDFKISNFQVDYYLDKDSDGRSTLKTVEVITAEFPSYDQNHGIERALPLSYDSHSVSLKVQSIEGLDGDNLNYTTYEDNNNLILRIGKSDTYVHGTNTYKITYTQRDVTRFFADSNDDEFYWDTNGTQWSQRFDNVTARLHVAPSIIDSLNGKQSCYYGFADSNDACVITIDGGTLTANTTNLSVGQNMTIAVGFLPHTFNVYQMSAEESAWRAALAIYFILAIIASIVTIALLIYMLILKQTKGQGAPGRGIIVPEYLPPSGVDVALSSIIAKKSSNWTAATYIDLAVRHNLRIIESKEGTIFKRTVYNLELLSVSKTTKTEESLLDDLFNGLQIGAKRKIDSRTPDYNLATKLTKIYKQSKAAALSDGYYVVDKKLRSVMIKTTVLIAILMIFTTGFGIVAVCIGVAIIMTTKPLSDKGRELKDYLSGLEMYIKTAEIDRIKVLQSPQGAEKTPVDTDDSKMLLHLYERVLPYAVLFGNEKEWAKVLGKFYEQQNSSPDWYAGNSAFNAVLFSSALSSFSSSANSFSTPSSSSSGGSGGGGFSGGGGGGGGGGGW